MNLEYEITEQDFAYAQSLAVKNSPARLLRWSRLTLPLFGAGLFLFLLHAIVQQGFSWRAIPGGAFCIFFMSIPLLTRREAKKLYAKTASLHGRVSLAVDEEGLRFKGPTFSTEVRWAHFQKFIEDDHSFLLYQNPQVFNIVPKRNLSPAQVVGLRESLEQHVARSV